MSFKIFLFPRILRRITYACRLVISDLLNRNADVFEYFKQCFSMVAKCHCTVMRIVALDQYMTVESPISGIANTPMDPKERVATGSTSPCAMYARSLQSAVLCRRKNVISPGAMSPSSVPCVTSSGRDLAMIS